MASTSSSRFFSSRLHTVVVCFGILNILLFVFTTAPTHFQTDISSEKLFGAVGEQIKHIFHCHIQRYGLNLSGRKTTLGDGTSSPPICIPTMGEREVSLNNPKLSCFSLLFYLHTLWNSTHQCRNIKHSTPA